VALAGELGTRMPSMAKVRWLFVLALAVIFAVGVGYAVGCSDSPRYSPFKRQT
jgi:hypothetical protein